MLGRLPSQPVFIADDGPDYFVPYLWVNHWLVFITYLQHTDPKLPHCMSPSSLTLSHVWHLTGGGN
jgi:hypothetical protein